MYAKLILMNVSATNLRTVELEEICFWIPLQRDKIKNLTSTKKEKKEKVKKESILSHLNKGLDIPVNYAEHSSFHPYNYSTTFQNWGNLKEI